MILYGGSGHAKVVLDCLYAQGISVQGIFDDNPTLKTFRNIPVWGSYKAECLPDSPLIISIGNNFIRRRVAAQVRHTFGRAVHSSAEVSRFVKSVGEGSVVFHRAVIQADAYIGNHCIINTAAVVDHDCVLGDFVHVSPNATLCGGVTVGEGTQVGASATVIPGVTIGQWCVIGAGAVVTRDVPDFSVAVGVPARIVRTLDAG